MKDDKITQSFLMKKVDWCGIFKNGKVPSDLLWKILMSGFGKYLKKYTKCPIMKNFEFERVHADSKMMLFVPSVKTRFEIWIELIGENGRKDLANISFIGQVVDE